MGLDQEGCMRKGVVGRSKRASERRVKKQKVKTKNNRKCKVEKRETKERQLKWAVEATIEGEGEEVIGGAWRDDDEGRVEGSVG